MTPTADKFTVLVNGQPVALTNADIRVDGSTVILNPSQVLYKDDVVQVLYTDSNSTNDTAGVIEDTSDAKNDAASFGTNQLTGGVVNNAKDPTPPAVDSTGPVLTGATVDATGNEITLTFNEPINAAVTPTADKFTVLVNGQH